jgi:hypothetical protein
MLELSEEGRRIVEALVNGPLAWRSPAELASAVGLDVEEATDLLADLDADGWLSPWEREGHVVVTLSVGAASRLGVRLVESGRDQALRWSSLGDPDPPLPKASGVFRNERAAWLELVVDPSGSPEEAAERAEEARERSSIPSNPRERVFIEGLPSPTLLIGVGLTPWPGPAEVRGAPCPSCCSRHLEPSTYCVYCDRWGLDHLLVNETKERGRTPRSAQEDARRQELERRTRKAKRKARRHAQSAARQSPRHRPGRAAT